MGQCFTSIDDDIAIFRQLIGSFWMYLWVMNCVKARWWDIVSVVTNLPSDKEEGVKALPFPEGGMVNAKFEAHITQMSYLWESCAH